MKVLDLLKISFRDIGVLSGQGEELEANDAQSGLSIFNMMLDQWSNEALLPFRKTTSSIATTANISDYYIGPAKWIITSVGGTYTAGSISITINGRTSLVAYHTDKATTLADLVTKITVDNQDVTVTATYASGNLTISLAPQSNTPNLIITSNLTLITGTMIFTIAQDTTNQPYTIDAVRPLDIKTLVIRDTTLSLAVDRPLKSLTNQEYQLIAVKASTSTYPEYFYYAPEYPLGKISVYPVPTKALTLYVTQNKSFWDLTLTDDIIFPKGYLSALRYNFDLEIAPQYEKNLSNFIVLQARNTKTIIENTNAEEVRSQPENFVNPKGSTYNILTDNP